MGLTMQNAGHGRRIAVAIVMALAVIGCTRIYRVGVAVDGASSNEQKLRIAQSIASESRLVRLREQLRAQFPSLSAGQLEGLGLSWNQTTSQSLAGQGSSTTIAVIITMRFEGNLDPSPVVEAASVIIRAEIAANDPPIRAGAAQ